ncbi:MAG: molybdopterin-dependent oxidoreductase, partial [Chloroflexi bacterium]|nr:molybdopterin-dependent oxidoreductase [Chloroflexota bacterium]
PGSMAGPYVVPAYRALGHVRLTNKTPCGTYRAPGRFESTFVRERLLDKTASELGRDRLEVRRTNFIDKADMPFVRGFATLETELTYDSGDYAGLVEQTLAKLDIGDLRAEVERRRGNGELVGLGYGFFVEKSGLGPAEGVRMSLGETGEVEIVTGSSSLGQGIETALAQIGAEGLGVAVEDVRVRHGQTNLIDHGMGSFASRVTVMTGSAVHIAAQRLKQKILKAASGLLQAEEDELDIIDGRIRVARGGDMALAEVALAHRSSLPPAGREEGGLSVEGWFETDHMNYPYGLHVAQVCLDRATGGVAVERFIIGYDVGRAVNPALIEGQLAGGAAQGIGGALMETFVYNEAGEPLTASFVDYLIPTVTEMPPVEVYIFEDAPSPINPLAVKGAGEGGINAVGAAVASAIDDALQQPGAISELPITPERVSALVGGRGEWIVAARPNAARRSPN